MAISNYKTKDGKSRYKAVLWKGNRIVARKSFERKQDAVEWHRRRAVQLGDSQVGRLKGQKMAFETFFRTVYWPNKRVREGTANDYESIYRTHIRERFGHRHFLEIGPEEWSEFFSLLIRKGISKPRANRIHTVLSAVYSMAVKWQYASLNPLRTVDWYNEDLCDFDYWNFDEVNQFLTWAHFNEKRFYPLYLAAYETGIRVSELIGLQKDCVDFLNGHIFVRRAWCSKTHVLQATTKSGRKRVLGMNVNLKATLRMLVESHTSAFVFCRANGLPLTYNSIRKKFMADQKLAGVRSIGFHDWRHTFASHYLMRSGKLADLKELLGHAEYSTTLRYAHLAADHLISKAGLVSFIPPTPDQVIRLKPKTPDHFPTIEEPKPDLVDSTEEKPKKADRI